MHKFLRAAGFADYDEAAVYRLIWQRVVQSGNMASIRDLGSKAAMYEYRLEVSENIGICAAVIEVSDRAELSYYYPYYISSENSSESACTLERHTAAETYAGVLDEYTLGISLIFFLNNPVDYGNYVQLHGEKEFKGASLSAFANDGMVLLPVAGGESDMYDDAAAFNRDMLIEAAYDGDEEAIETLTASDISMFQELNDRIEKEDLYSVVEQSFMPCGIECDQYSIIGAILGVSEAENALTKEGLWLLRVSCNDIIFWLCIRKDDLMGEPMKGRRIKCRLWMQGKVDIVI